ncbi:MAG TPA: hypothetical protein VMF89_30615, partial [Polyangiales bacterium]|nr:hypothetical protein [Polyangiales bacterium]
VTLLSATEAEGIWSMFDDVRTERPGEQPRRIQSYGRYFETYRKCPDGRWRISSKRNVRQRPADDEVHSFNRLRLGRLSRDKWAGGALLRLQRMPRAPKFQLRANSRLLRCSSVTALPFRAAALQGAQLQTV